MIVAFNKIWFLLILALLISPSHTSTSTDNISQGIAEKLSSFMARWFDKDAITRVYSFKSYKTYSGSDILKELKINVTKQFLNSEKALANIRESALGSFYNYTGDRYDFDFLERFKNKTHKNLTVKYKETANFKREVSVTNSSLVLPLDVYYNWSKVRETILWTAKMDDVFKTNWSPNLTGSATLLQYIGTPHGVMRVYPSYYTPRVGKWVTYDHRFRIWYAVGAMESNKVVFVMDKSGTLVGEPVKLMREMAINIIKTMISDEDYISVLTFNDVVEPLGCGANLVRARSRIKTILNEQIRKISPEGPGNMTEAIRMGFDILNQSKSQQTCHSTLVLFTDYTQTDVLKIIQKYNGQHAVKVVILQVGKDIMFSTDLKKVAAAVNGVYSRIENLSDISPTILNLTGEYTSLVDDDDLQVKTTPMYKDASTEEYITTLVLPVVTDKRANWTKESSLHMQQDTGSFLGVAAVDIEAKSLGQYPLSTARGCYAITVDQKGSVLYHPVLYRTTESIEIDQKLHLYSFLDDGLTMKLVEQHMVFQKNFSGPLELPYLEVSDSTMSLRTRSFANKYYINVLVAVDQKISLLHICNRKTLSFPTNENVMNKKVNEIVPPHSGPHSDNSRDTAYCNYSDLSLRDIKRDNETVKEYVSRKLQFPECHSYAYEIFDDILMVNTHLRRYLTKDTRLSVTTAAGNRFEVTLGKKLRRVNYGNTRQRYNRLVSLITNNNNNQDMIAVRNVTSVSSHQHMFEISQLIYHIPSDSYPLMLSVELGAFDFEHIIEDPFRTMRTELGGNRYLIDENAYVINSEDPHANGKHLAILFPRLMESLLRKGIFRKFDHTECYFSCEVDYPIDSHLNRTSSAAHALRRYVLYPSYRLLGEVALSLGSFLSSFMYQLIFIIFNPITFVTSMPDSSTKYNEAWKIIKINLTCCHIHPFMSRNFSVVVDKASVVDPDETCTKRYRYSAVPNTNLIFVWAWCNDELCLCDEPSYNMTTVTNKILNPCSESDVNYNPAVHCTTDRGPRHHVSGATTLGLSLYIAVVLLVAGCVTISGESYR